MGQKAKWWFIQHGYRNSIPSVAEARIAKKLSEVEVEFYREVSFESFKTPKGGYYRYDFYIPSMKLLIEYDGYTHTLPGADISDSAKTKYAKDNGLVLKRFNNKHWNTLEEDVYNYILSRFMGYKDPTTARPKKKTKQSAMRHPKWSK